MVRWPTKSHDGALICRAKRTRVRSFVFKLRGRTLGDPPPNAFALDGALYEQPQEVFCTPVDIEFLRQTQHGAVQLVCYVISSITAMGWQFPGMKGPGAAIYRRNS